jgi:hypothetical protein
MISVLTWLWRPRRGYAKPFDVTHVNAMRALVAQHCSLDHEFVCVTDQPDAAFDPRVRVVPLWSDHAELPGAWALGPSCWRRLRLFAPEAHELLGLPAGSSVASLDLDCVPVRSLERLWSMFLHRLGSLPRVWEDFSYERAVAESKQRGFTGTDQAWIACHVAGKYPVWTTADGVYSFKNHLLPSGALPRGARIVFFHGRPNQWDADVRREYPWIRQHYPLEVSGADLRIQRAV